MGKAVEITGLNKLQFKLSSLPKVISDEIALELEASAQTIAANAKRDAPKDIGGLAGGISAHKLKKMAWEVVSLAPYSPYMEWGTGSKAQIPADEAEFAAQFKGKSGGGNAKEAFEQIKEWVRRIGLPEDAAYPIFKSIMKNGVKPHPFFFHNYLAERPKLIERVKKILENAVKK